MHLHHLHIRKRISQSLEPYPARSPWMRLLDKAIFGAGVIGPIFSIPQIVLIYSSQDATGISAVSWFGWAALDIVWILYGLVHKEPPIVMTYTFWFIINLTVAFGAILYG
ncbi:MAG: PQ-loop domain-containing transporter [bacterium]|nr:PQ-loop domain-containing transporter [bacterium]